MWTAEQAFEDDGSELSTGALSTTLGTTLQCLYDGRFMWVTCTNGIAIYEFWGASSDDEPSADEISDLTLPRYLEAGAKRKLKLITFISIGASQMKRSTRYSALSPAPSSTTVLRPDLTVYTEISASSSALSPYWITKVNDKICVSSGATFSKIFVFDIASQRYESTLTLNNEASGTPCIANSNLHGQNGKLWVVNSMFNDSTPQRLITKTLAGTETSTNINVRPSLTRTWIADGFNGQVYITNFNGVSISRYDQETAALGARIRTSAWPHHIWSTQDRRIFAASGDNLLTLVDYDDDGVHHDYNSETVASDLVRDPRDSGRVFFARSADVVQYALADGDMKILGTGSEDWYIAGTGVSEPTALAAIPSQVFFKADGSTRSTRPYLFILNGSKVLLLPLDSNLKRTYYSELNGQGAIVGGTLQYFGEQG